MSDSEDCALFESIGNYMKGQSDLDDVHNDLAFQSTQEAVKDMISDYNKNKSGNRENEKFIRDIFSDEFSAERLSDEIKSIKQEINNNNLNEITADWVKEWHEKKQKTGTTDPKSEEIRNFITDAISSPKKEPVKTRNLFIRYASLSSAAMIGIFILLRTLLPSSDSDKLFSTYYKPFEALSSVTRSINNSETDNFSSGIESYKSGNYPKSAAEFAGLLEKSPSSVSARFFLGLSQLSLGNYGQAENLLSAVLKEQGEYAKEARWYLGLTYLKINNKQKAEECFGVLASSDGYYRERSEKILRRLK
jgi:TolA-binding protein